MASCCRTRPAPATPRPPRKSDIRRLRRNVRWCQKPTSNTERSVIYARIARCVQRERLGDPTPYWDKALAAAEATLSKFVTPGMMGHEPRDTGRVIPWFEGVYEIVLSAHAIAMENKDLLERLNKVANTDRLNKIAQLLADHLTKDHPCDDTDVARNAKRCSANAFFVLPQGSFATDSTVPWRNWITMEDVPLALPSVRPKNP
jgi:hypothetical protein